MPLLTPEPGRCTEREAGARRAGTSRRWIRRTSLAEVQKNAGLNGYSITTIAEDAFDSATTGYAIPFEV